MVCISENTCSDSSLYCYGDILFNEGPWRSNVACFLGPLDLAQSPTAYMVEKIGECH